MLLNARRIRKPGNHSELILLAIEDITESHDAQEKLEVSEIRYRRLFEAAKDGILILDTVHGRVTDANPFMAQLLGYSEQDFIGKELWEIGLLQDASASQAMVRELQEKGYVRYEHLPLETTKGRQVEVEVVANVYQEDHQPVIQCNIRDITERSHLENKTKEQAKSLADLHRRKDEFLARANASSLPESIVSRGLAAVKASSEQFSVDRTESRVSRRCWHGWSFACDGVAL